MRSIARCERIRRELSLRAPGEPPLRETTRRHLEACADCAAFRDRLNGLEAQTQAWRNGAPAPSLEARIASALLQERAAAQQTRPERSRPHWSLSRLKENRTVIKQFAWGGVALLTVALLTVGHQAGQANTALKRMGAAASKIRSVHLIGWNCALAPEVAERVRKGDTQISVAAALPHRFEAWVQNGQWREAQDFDVTLYREGKVWKNGVPTPQENQPPRLTAFAFRAITGENPFGKGTEFAAQIQGEDSAQGHPAIKLLLESRKKSGPDGSLPIQERRVFWLDPKTDLPLRLELQRYTLDRWELDAVIWFDYDVPVQTALFDPQKVKAERHGPVDYARPSAKDLYRLSEEQYARYTAALAEYGQEQQRIRSEQTLSQEQKDRQMAQAGANHRAQIRQMMDVDQQRLFDDWWYVQPKVLDKLATPQQREEEARWRAEQQTLLREWVRTLDPQARQRLGMPTEADAQR